ncbi:glycosyltransferase family 39 protein [Nocardioides cheoyonin]|uniref:glycosyltransferase family 39 protein n=1 Tax=Nocardioides cheoyonin TaxID=3156615 RepID=UPI0032B538DB
MQTETDLGPDAAVATAGDAVRRRPGVPTVLLGAVLAGSLALRLVGIRHGLPFAYNPDEELHFVPQAAAAADGRLDPHYFDNPAGLTYLLAAVFRLVFLGRDVTALLDDHPALVLTVARVVVALLGTLLVLLVHHAARRYAGRVAALVSAALVGTPFLPVFYSHQALNDVPTMLAVTAALTGALAVLERGDLRSYVLAGAAVGVAAAFKYQAGAWAVAVALAALLRVLRGRDRAARVLGLLVVAGVTSAVALLALNPYLLLDAGTALRAITHQSDLADTGKLGQTGTGWTYYPRSLLWGLGVVPTALAVVGAAAGLRRDRARTLLLVVVPVLLYLYLGGQGRFFARWLLPAYPALAILAGLGVVRTAGFVRRRLPARSPTALRALVLPVLAVLALAQPLADSVRSDRVLAREDTRSQALAWLRDHVRGDRRVVVEPAVPADYLEGTGLTALPVERPYQDYETRLRPEAVDGYRRDGYCWVMVNSLQRDRGLVAGLPGARAYYARLERETVQRVVFSPYRPGASAPRFSYDWSFDWYPPAYDRPGPYVELVRLRGCPSR